MEQVFYEMSALTAKGNRRKQNAGDNSLKRKHISFNSFITVAQKTFFSFPLYSRKLMLKKPHASLSFTGLRRKKAKHTNLGIPRIIVLGARSGLIGSVIHDN